MSITRRELGAICALPFHSTARGVTGASERPPNFIILLSDDLGYGDLGCYGSQTLDTPNVDRMAAEGTRLTEFYAEPTCTPARASLLTGRYPLRSGLTRVLIPREHFGIPETEITLADALRPRGYRTSCIGKWHLGDRPLYRPERHGFDRFYGLLYSNDMTLPVVNWPPIRLFNGNKPIESPAKQQHLTQRFTEQALEFIRGNKDTPFFLYLAYTMPHLPWRPSPDFAATSSYGPYGDVVREIDWSVGQILNELARQGLDKNTVVAFLSDNGPELATSRPGGSTGGLRGGKGSTWEGGVRVPCVIRWPGKISHVTARRGITSTMDLFATFAKLAGAEFPSDHVIDGVDLMPFLKGESESPQSVHGYYHRKDLCALRWENWKLHFIKIERSEKGHLRPPSPANPPELYDLELDPGESRNIASNHPEVVAQLTNLAERFSASIVAGKLAPPHWKSLLPAGRRRRQKG